MQLIRKFLFCKTFVLFLSGFLISGLNVFAQKQSNIWYFGQNAGIDFNSGSPVSLSNGMLNTQEGCASLADQSGNLVFYTDGILVYNKNHIQMPNGFGLKGDPSASESAVIVPQPGHPTIYYIFTAAAWGGADGIQYSIVDITQNGGLGDVTTKNTFLYGFSAERLSAVKHANGCDIWIITQDYQNQRFQTFKLTSSGLNTTPVISPSPISNATYAGCMKVSVDGKHVAVADWSGSFGLYDFNTATGMLSNSRLLNSSGTYASYGVEFSPDGKVLYAAGANHTDIDQFNISLGTAAAINASMLVVGTTSGGYYSGDAGAFQVGPDGKIYMARWAGQYLGVINNPNTLGAGCNFVDNGVLLNAGTSSQWGLPNFVQSFITSNSSATVLSSSSCLQGSFSASDTTGATSILWSFGDPSTGASNASALYNATHTFSGSGTYNVQAIIYKACSNDTIKQSININACGPMTLSSSSANTKCSGSSDGMAVAKASAGKPSYTYSWSTSASSVTSSATDTLKNLAPGTYVVTVTDGNDSILTSTIVIAAPTALSITSLTATSVGCGSANNGTASVAATGGTGTIKYKWSSAATSQTATNLTAGNYTVTITDGNACTTTAVDTVKTVNTLAVNAGMDDTLCAGASVQLNAVSGASAYSWSPAAGLSNASIKNPVASPAVPTQYIVTATLGSCTAKDTVNVVVNPLPVANAGADRKVLVGTEVVLTGSGGGTYSWTPSAGMSDATSASPSVQPVATTMYILKVMDVNGCASQDTVIITVDDDCGDVFTPTAFSPNGDGKNDIYYVRNPCMKELKFFICNRWGEKVFETNNAANGWDGNFRGEKCDTGVFVYFLEATLITNVKVSRKGNITLLR